MSASLSDQEIEDRYFLLGRMEILNVLNELIHRRIPVTVYFAGGKDFILSLLLSARSDALVFDLGSDEKTNRLLVKSAGCVFVAFPDGIRVQFSCVDPARFEWDESDAFWAPLPDRVIRLQRRDNYRNIVPVVNALRVQLEDEHDTILGDWPLHDLSVGGVAATISGDPLFKAGDVIAHVVIQISDKKKLDCVGIIRHITQVDRQGKGHSRVGIEFINLPHVMEVAIQRYINKIEYERHKLLMK